MSMLPLCCSRASLIQQQLAWPGGRAGSCRTVHMQDRALIAGQGLLDRNAGVLESGKVAKPGGDAWQHQLCSVIPPFLLTHALVRI